MHRAVTRRVAAVLGAAVLGAAGGCSTGRTDDARSTTTSSTTTTSSRPRAAGDPGVGLFYFKSPSGNIGCAIDASDARCDIGSHTYAPNPRPAGCDLDWGDALGLTGTHADFVCHGDTVRVDTAAVLPYGGAIERGDLTCESDESGMTCSERRFGHGFFVSRDQFRIF